MTTYFSAKELLRAPTERAAFSDRQAYVCAELSRLAYFKFEGGFEIDQVLELARGFVREDDRFQALEKQLRHLLSRSPDASKEAKTVLSEILEAAEFRLVETFSERGTQAFICTKAIDIGSSTTKTVAFVVFRGTEPTDFRDIRTDVRASLATLTVGQRVMEVHSGYLAAFGHVRQGIEATLRSTAYDQLFLTGHSLGGALAALATRVLAADDTGACYTFGAPPVGTQSVQDGLKTPTYHIINEVDIVPRLPNPWTASGILFLFRLFRLLAKSVTWLEKMLLDGTWDERLEAFVQAMTQYRHPGYVSYLVGRGQDAQLRYNVSSFDRFRWWTSMMWKQRLFQFGRMVSDHAIDAYVDKLTAHAAKRQEPSA